MSGLYTQPNSPYYWLRYYDKFEEDTRKRRKSLNTKITITEKYTLKQIRPTFASFLINVYAMDIYDVQKLLDHADIKITDKHYVNYNTQRVRRKMEAITYDSFLNGEFE